MYTYGYVIHLVVLCLTIDKLPKLAHSKNNLYIRHWYSTTVNIGIYFVTIENNRRIQWWKEIVSSQNRLRQIGRWIIADDPAAIIDRWRPDVQKLIRHNDASVTSLGRNATGMGRRTDLSLFVPYGEKKNNIVHGYIHQTFHNDIL